ncbi:hypothetical protein Lal_00036443 [Lupinus albus]|uniref:Uncharacterized protein n=1 Tax=Lupinus albus TaxID=3870 RepID=A0A6A5P4G4_LUPAL|nr:hypothetical protein Lalb_Chr18g0045491 [Lupinus albus]KAF1892088.1 hypothetical protein Lal_00036443 [Lupinus albus]
MREWRVLLPLQQRVCSNGILKWVLVWVCFCFLVFMVGPKSKWKLKETSPTCSSCECYCSSPEESYLDLSECGKDDPVIYEEVKKDILTMLSEELNLQKIVANETLEHTKRLIMDTRKTFSHYQKEAEKCNVGVETCEEARERAESELIEELRLSTLWENRAHEYGWNDIDSF